MNFSLNLQEAASLAVKTLYGVDIKAAEIIIQKTVELYREEGDFTLVVFPYSKLSKKSPEITAQEMGEFLMENTPLLHSFSVVKGFLNLKLLSRFWLHFLNQNPALPRLPEEERRKILIEFSSPNTNKPLHLGHIRNNLLGWSVAEILQAVGHEVIKVNLVNDRGIHICKSMLAWKKWGNGETPDHSGLKGDHLVGKYYVLFDQQYKQEIKELIQKGYSEDQAKEKSALMLEARKMLQDWEAKDPIVDDIWEKMNGWVYQGFDETYQKLGISFHRTYYESNTWKTGKTMVEKALAEGICIQKEDGSVWVDLSADGLDEKILLRADGTSVYMTQDLGTAHLRYVDYHPDQMLYVVGNEQNYHFEVLKLVLEKKLGFSWARGIQHLSYGMVELPDGKMKSREGTVVDADMLIQEMEITAKNTTETLGKSNDFNSEEKNHLFSQLALGALKYFILKVDPVKNMTFDPKESIDFNGNTGPFIQYTHARICSLLAKSDFRSGEDTAVPDTTPLQSKERQLICRLYELQEVVLDAAKRYSPALLANFAFELAKEYNQFYHDFPVLKEENTDIKKLRLIISWQTASALKISMQLLGIQLPERM